MSNSSTMVTAMELPPKWRGAFMPSQTCVGLHKVQMYKISRAGEKARGTQPSTAASGRKEDLARMVVCELVCSLINITSLEGYWQIEGGKSQTLNCITLCSQGRFSPSFLSL